MYNEPTIEQLQTMVKAEKVTQKAADNYDLMAKMPLIRDHLASYLHINRNKIRNDLARIGFTHIYFSDFRWFSKLCRDHGRERVLSLIMKIIKKDQKDISSALNTKRSLWFRRDHYVGNDEEYAGVRIDRLIISLKEQ